MTQSCGAKSVSRLMEFHCRIMSDSWNSGLINGSWHFSLHKCKVMHLGYDYSTTYELHHNQKPRVLDETVEEKDLGVYVNTGLKPSTQCAKSANRAMSVLRMVTRNFPRTDRADFAVLY